MMQSSQRPARLLKHERQRQRPPCSTRVARTSPSSALSPSSSRGTSSMRPSKSPSISTPSSSSSSPRGRSSSCGPLSRLPPSRASSSSASRCSFVFAPRIWSSFSTWLLTSCAPVVSPSPRPTPSTSRNSPAAVSRTFNICWALRSGAQNERRLRLTDRTGNTELEYEDEPRWLVGDCCD
jgi:hypothetical protein